MKDMILPDITDVLGNRVLFSFVAYSKFLILGAFNFLVDFQVLEIDIYINTTLNINFNLTVVWNTEPIIKIKHNINDTIISAIKTGHLNYN